MDRNGYTDMLQRYLSSGAELNIIDDHYHQDPDCHNVQQLHPSITIINQDDIQQIAEDDDVFDLPSEFHLDDRIVAECAEYWAPHYLHKDGTLSPELVQIITDLNSEQVASGNTSLSTSTITLTKNNKDMDIVTNTNDQCIEGIKLTCYGQFEHSDAHNGKSISNRKIKRTEIGASGGSRSRKRVPKSSSLTNGADATNKQQKSCKRKTQSSTLAASGNVGGVSSGNINAPNSDSVINSVIAEDSTSHNNGCEIDMNEEQKTELVEQLVRLIKDQTKELEENKIGSVSNHYSETGKIKSCPVPSGWERIRISKPASVVYLSPSGELLSNMLALQDYLMRTGTCKCGIDCPLIIDQTFNFDPCVVNMSSIDSLAQHSSSRSTKHPCSCNLTKSKCQQLQQSPSSSIGSSPTKRARGRPRKTDRPTTKSSCSKQSNLSLMSNDSDLARSISDILRQSLTCPTKTVRKRSHYNSGTASTNESCKSHTVKSTKAALSPRLNNHNSPVLVDVMSTISSTNASANCSTQSVYSKENESLAIRQLYNLVTNKNNGQEKITNVESQSGKPSLDNEFLPNIDLLRSVDDPTVHNFAKHLIFTNPSDSKNSFTFDVVKPKSRSRRNRNDARKSDSGKALKVGTNNQIDLNKRLSVSDSLPSIDVLNCDDGSICINDNPNCIGAMDDNLFDLFNNFNDELNLFEDSCSVATDSLFNRTEVSSFEDCWPVKVQFAALAHVQGQELCARTALLLIVQIEVVIKKLETKLTETNKLEKLVESNIVSLQDSITKPIDELTKDVSILKSEIVELKTINNLPFNNPKMEHLIKKSWANVASKSMPALIRRQVARSIVATTQVPSAEVSTINRAINAEAFRARNLIIKGFLSSDNDTFAIVDLLRKISVNVGRSDIKNIDRLPGIREDIPRWLKTTLTEPIVTESLRSASKLRHLQGCAGIFLQNDLSKTERDELQILRSLLKSKRTAS
ncbi:hypothetical protein GJ496_011528 [Pomphorhynchus laevis]|nr:hypothetical protein GJ496_011528 [Pomphorhynchus laevis]